MMHKQRTIRRLPVALLLLAVAAALSQALAQQRTRTLYRCTDIYGQVTVQDNRPCPRTSQQERIAIDPVQSMPRYQPPPLLPAPAPAPSPAPPAPAPAPAPDSADSNAEPEPPPPLYQCTMHDGVEFLTENDTPTERCLPLNIVGIGGVQGIGAGSACQRVRDTCEEVAEAERCTHWRRYVREAEAAWRFARAEDGERLQKAYQQARNTLQQSNCEK